MRTAVDSAIPQSAAVRGTVSRPDNDASSQGSLSPLSPKVVHAAHEFEASMMKELMTSLEPGHDSWGGDEEEDGSGSSLSDFAGEALSQAISEHGGFGIADRIIRQLSSESNHSGKTTGAQRRFETDAKEAL
jgi:Rod binding domain-containing protein